MRNRNLGLVIACGLLAVVACGDDNGEGSDESSEEEQDTGQPPGWKVIEESDQSLTLNEEPLWGSDAENPMDRVLAAELHDDTAILLRASSDNSPTVDRIDVVDATTGQLRWSVSEGDDLPVGDGAEASLSAPRSDIQLPLIVEPADDQWALLVEYRLRLDEQALLLSERGVVALSGKDGEVLWTTPVVTDGGPRSPRWLNLEADLDLVLATVHPVDEDGECSMLTECLQFLAIDASDGSVLEESPATFTTGVPPAAHPAGGELVLTQVANEEPADGPVSGGILPDTTVVALDAVSGEEQWNLSERASLSQMLLVAGDMALVRVSVDEPPDNQPSFPNETIVVDVRTGEEVASFGKFADDCTTDGESLFACKVYQPTGTEPDPGRLPDGDPHLATFRIEDRDTTVSAQAVPRAERFLGSSQGYVAAGDPEDGFAVLLDRAGSEIDLGLPGTVLAMSDSYAVVADQPLPGEDGQPLPSTYTVHEVTIG